MVVYKSYRSSAARSTSEYFASILTRRELQPCHARRANEQSTKRRSEEWQPAKQGASGTGSQWDSEPVNRESVERGVSGTESQCMTALGVYLVSN